MSAALEALLAVRSRGTRVWADGGSLRFEAPKGAMRPEDLALLRTFKHEILGLLGESAAVNAAPLERHSRRDTAPLTPFQRRVLDSAAYREGIFRRAYASRLHIRGPLNTDALRRAISSVRLRHEILRTTFERSGDRIVPRVQEFSHEPLHTVEVTSASLDAELHAFANSPVRLEDPALFDARLFRLSADEHVLALASDNLNSDCTSNALVSREIWASYARLCRGEELPASTNAPQLADYAVWLEDIQPAWMQAHAGYWREHLRNAAPTTLPVGAGKGDATKRVTVPVSMDDRVAEGLLACARERHTFPALVVLTAYVQTLARWLDREDLTLVMVDHGRYRPELETMVGCLVNHLPLRIQTRGCDSFEDWLRRVGAALEGAHEHRDLNRAPSLVPDLRTDFYFNWVTAGDDDIVHDAGLNIESSSLKSEPLLPDFGVAFSHGQNLSGALTYREAACHPDAATEFLRLFAAALSRLAYPVTTPSDARNEPRPRGITERVPLTFSQRRWWNRLELDTRPSARTVASAIRLRGSLKIETLRRAFEQLADRHEALRTRIVRVDGVPEQVVDRTLTDPFDFVSLSARAPAERETDARQLADALVREPSHIARGPLWAARLIELDPSEHILVVALDHIISDAQSLGIFWQDMMSLYRGDSVGTPRIQFPDYAVWLAADEARWSQTHGAFWTTYLDGASGVRLVPPEQAERWQTLRVELGESLSQGLRDSSRQLHTSLVMSVLTVFAAAVMRWCNVTDLVIPVITNGRLHASVSRTIGYFSTPLFLRVGLSAADSYADLVKQVTEQYASTMERYDFGRVGARRPEPRFAQNPSFNWIPDEYKVGAPERYEIAPLDEVERCEEVRLSLSDAGGQISGLIRFRGGRQSRESLEDFAGCLRHFAVELVRDPRTRVSATGTSSKR